jgi:hypothetical protein
LTKQLAQPIDLSSVYNTLASSMEMTQCLYVNGRWHNEQPKMRSDQWHQTVIKELYRVLVVQQMVGSFNAATGTVFGYAGFIGGGFAPKPARAAGGPVQAGVPAYNGRTWA